MPARKRRLAAALTALAMAGVALATQASAATAPGHYSSTPTDLLNATGPFAAVATQPPSLCGGPPTNLNLGADGDPVTVHLPPGPDFVIGKIDPASWRNPGPLSTDPTWQLAYRGLIWAQGPAYLSDYLLFSTTYETIVKQVLAFYAADPDPGVPATGGYGDSTAYGWDEGTSMRRLTTLNCLYSLKADARLKAPMAMEVAVQFGPRYYGPPRFPVHNHGLMANIAIYHAGQLTGNSTWTADAAARLKSEAPLAFTALGFTHEQSTGYHLDLIYGWQLAADMLKADDPAAAAAITALVTKARTVGRWLTMPDGKLVQIGGGSYEDPGDTSATYLPAAGTREIHDDSVGWLIGRWSFTDPLTTFYTVRYGPPRYAHGYQDRSGVTFGTLGTRVLVEPGTYSYDTANNNNAAWETWPTANNVVAPSGITLSTKASVTRSAETLLSTSHSITFTDALYPDRTHSRWVAVYPGTHSMRVRDTETDATTTTDQRFRQSWHLDPAWTFISQNTAGTSATFAHPSGRKLVVTTTGRFSSIIRGQSRPMAGWHFPHWLVQQAAEELTLRDYGGNLDTTFAVS